MILSTHIVSDIEAIADEVLLMKKGKFIFQGSVPELIKKADRKVWELMVPQEEARKWQAKSTVANLRHEGGQVAFRIISDHKPSEMAVPCEATLRIDYFEPEKLTDFYGRRKVAIEKYLENNNQTGKEKEYLLQIEEKVINPFHYAWIRGWETLLGRTIDTSEGSMAVFLAIVLSTLFAGEWHNNTSSLVLTSKNGWEKIAFAKIVTGLAFTVELFAMVAISQIVSQLFFIGTTGWDMPIQVIKLIAIAPMNMLQGEIYEYAFTLLGMVGFAGSVMLISATVKSNVLALILSLAVVYVPTLIDPYLPYGLQKALDLIPLVGSGTDIFRTNTFNFFGKIIWSPYLLITVPVLIGIVCMPFAIKGWSRRLKV